MLNGDILEPRYKDVKVDQEKKEVLHDLDQFVWFEACSEYGPAPEGISRESAVNFVLPNSNMLDGGNLFVVGRGIGECQAYLSCWSLEGKIRNYHLFDYSLQEEKQSFSPKFIGNFDGVKRIFTTEVKPFLHRGDYPAFFERVYLIPLFGSDYLEVRANPSESRKEDYFSVSFLRDKRDGGSVEIVRLSRIKDAGKEKERWSSPQLENLK